MQTPRHPGSLSYVTRDRETVIVEQDVAEVYVIRGHVSASESDIEAIRCRIEARACFVDISKGDNAIDGRSTEPASHLADEEEYPPGSGPHGC